MPQVTTLTNEELKSMIAVLEANLGKVSPKIPKDIIRAFRAQLVCFTELQNYRLQYGRITHVSVNIP